MSEEFCQLLHFDRSGAQYSTPFNIHAQVKTFIRLILGLSSFDENVVGLDTAVKWTVEGGRKVAGTIAVTDNSGKRTEYAMCDVEPSFRRWGLEGRGTTGWRVLSPQGVELFIKECWRPEGGLAEHVVLAKTAEQDGTPRMVAFEAREESTASLRANGNESWSSEPFTGRVFTRIVMEHCGKSVESFESQKHLVSAIRDAVAGEYPYVSFCPIPRSSLIFQLIKRL